MLKRAHSSNIFGRNMLATFEQAYFNTCMKMQAQAKHSWACAALLQPTMYKNISN